MSETKKKDARVHIRLSRARVKAEWTELMRRARTKNPQITDDEVIAGLMRGDKEIAALQQKPGTTIEVQALVLQALSTIISIEKIPYVVALCQLYLTGDVDPDDIWSATSVRRMLTSLDLIDTGELRQELRSVAHVHVLFDTSKRGNLPRAPVQIAFFDHREQKPTRRLLSASALASEKAEEEAKELYAALGRFGLTGKVVSIICDNAPAMQAPQGTIAVLIELLGDARVIVAGCALHMASLCLKNACDRTFTSTGRVKAETDVTKIREVTLVHVLFASWWVGNSGMSRSEFLDSLRVFGMEEEDLPEQQQKPIWTRWLTVADANDWLVRNAAVLEDWCLEVSKEHVASNRRKLRTTLEYLRAWLQTPDLQLYSFCLHEFVLRFYRNMHVWFETPTTAAKDITFEPGFKGAFDGWPCHRLGGQPLSSQLVDRWEPPGVVSRDSQAEARYHNRRQEDGHATRYEFQEHVQRVCLPMVGVSTCARQSRRPDQWSRCCRCAV
jgi:hypothetical protein